jgi:phage terminase large subunit GpA-like protein
MEADELLKEVQPLWAPPPNLTGSEWADKFRVVAAGPFPGPWKTNRTPYLKEPLDCVTDKRVEKIVIMKPTRVGATEGIINNALGYHIHYDPCQIMLVQTSDGEGRKYSKEIFQPMVEATPVLNALIEKKAGRYAEQTILNKTFPGGNISIVGGISPKNFRMVSKRVVVCDDIDGIERNPEGDVIKLAEGRTKDYWNSLIILASNPTHKYVSRIYRAFKASDMRYRYVPCPHCNEFQVLKMGGKDTDYGLKWDNADDLEVWYECEHCHEKIYDYQKGAMDLKGEYRAEKEFKGTAGFHINPFLCTWHPWSEFKKEFLEVKNDPNELMVFVNQYLGEVWEDNKDERVTEQELYDRRENYAAEVPQGVLILTAAIDVQATYIVVEVKGWGRGEESWGIDYKVINGRFLEERTQQALDDYLLQTFKHESGVNIPIKISAIDLGGHYTAQVYEYCRRREAQNIYAVKGANVASADVLDGELREKGQTRWQMVGVSACKDILYGRLKVKTPGASYFHFPMKYDMEYFNELLSEVPVVNKAKERRWEIIPGRRNEAVDLHSYNLAALRMYNPDWDLLQKQDLLEDQSKRIFINHDIKKHCDPNIIIDESKPLIVCCIFNANPTVWVLCQTDGKVVKVIDEIVLRNATTAKMCIEVTRKYGTHKGGFIIYGSATGSIRSSTSKSEYTILKEYGFTRQKIKLKNPLESDVINSVYNMLSNVKDETKLSYHPRCILLGKDFRFGLYTDQGEFDKFEYSRGLAFQALGYYINIEWPLKFKSNTPKNRFYK